MRTQGQRVWRLLPNTVKPATNKLPAVEVVETAAKIPFSMDTTHPAEAKESKLERTVREQLALERKQADSVNLTPASDKKKKRKRDKATKTSNKTNVKATKSEKTDVVSSAKGSGDSEEFVPHDYVKASLTTQLQDEEKSDPSPATKKKKKKKREFDPNLAIADSDHKPVKRRSVHKSANKSMTYGTTTMINSLPKIPWPKR